ncbi:glycosyltransferase [Parabacteroides sp.]
MKEYDFLFVQNAPAFYKINLFNVLSDNYRIGVVFLGESKEVVINRCSKQWKFDVYYFNNNIDRNNAIDVFVNLWKMWKLISTVKYRHIVYGGWINVEFVIMMFLTSRRRNCVISESGIYESVIHGVKGFLKRLILNRNSHAFVSGIPHKDLLLRLKYHGMIHITGGVGLTLRNHNQFRYAGHHEDGPLRYVYTGRIIELKNIKLLIMAFNENGKQLTIIGTGCKETEYQAMAKSNITFLGFIDNSKLKEIYANCDCLILPSHSEPWGLVVEEALYNGLPVIVSDMVGCNVDMVKNYDSGVVFNHQSIDSLQNAIEQMEQNYRHYKNNVMAIDWEKRDREQIEAFTDICQV